MWSLGAQLLGARRGGVYERRLSDERTLEPFASLVRAFETAPQHLTTTITGGGLSPLVRIATQEIGERQGEVIVCVHGVFTDRTMWRYLAGAMAEQGRNVLLIDLPGCGDSDKPRPTRRNRALYAPGALARRVLAALRSHLRTRKDSPRVRLVAHSLGGAVVIRMFAAAALRQEFADVLERVDSMLLLAPLDVAVNKENPDLTRLRRVSNIKIWSARGLGTLRENLASALLSGCGPDAPVMRREADHKLRVLTHTPSRLAMQAMLHQAVPHEKGRPRWDKIEPIVAGYSHVSPRTLIVWGECDEVLPVSMGYKLAAQLPKAKLVTLPRCGHSLVLEQPREVARLAERFLCERTGDKPQPAAEAILV